MDNIPGDLEKYQIDDASLKLAYIDYADDDLKTKSEVVFLGNISSCSVSDEADGGGTGGAVGTISIYSIIGVVCI